MASLKILRYQMLHFSHKKTRILKLLLIVLVIIGANKVYQVYQIQFIKSDPMRLARTFASSLLNNDASLANSLSISSKNKDIQEWDNTFNPSDCRIAIFKSSTSTRELHKELTRAVYQVKFVDYCSNLDQWRCRIVHEVEVEELNSNWIVVNWSKITEDISYIQCNRF